MTRSLSRGTVFPRKRKKVMGDNNDKSLSRGTVFPRTRQNLMGNNNDKVTIARHSLPEEQKEGDGRQAMTRPLSRGKFFPRNRKKVMRDKQ